MQYAKDDNGVLGYPTDEEFRGVPNWQTHDRLLRMRGYLPLVGEADKRDGFAAWPKSWLTVGQGDESYIQVTEWEYAPVPAPPPVPEPVVRYSKYKIQLACQKRGLWPNVKDAIANSGKQDSWDNIIDIRSDNDELKAVLPDIRAAFGSDVVDAVLAESVAEDE